MNLYLESKDKRYDDRLAFIVDSKEILRKEHNIIFVNNPELCDVYITHQTVEKPDLKDAFSSKKPVIIIQRADSANIVNEEMRSAIKNDKVVGFFKISNFKDIDNHNRETTGDKRYHLNFINNNLYPKQKYQNIFTDKELRKISCAIPAFYNFRFDHVRKASTYFEHSREIALNFAGIVDYSKNKNYVNMSKENERYDIIRILNSHRKKAFEKVVEYGEKKNEKVIAHFGKPFDQPQYWQSLLISKISLSPWGFGAYNWRDFETIYLGGILIKPDTDFLESYCNLYDSNKYYFKCDPNFENIFEICDSILGNYDHAILKTRSAQNLLYENYNINKIAKRFATQIKNCFKGN